MSVREQQRQYLGNLSAQEAASYPVVKCITQYIHMATAVAAPLKLNFECVYCSTYDMIPCK